MKDTILIISPILALIISAITVIINLSVRGEDSFQKTLDLLNAHTEHGDDDRVINTFTKEVVLRQIIRRQIARAYKPFSILSFIGFIVKFVALLSLSVFVALLALFPSGVIDLEIRPWVRVIFGAISLALLISCAYIIARTISGESIISDDNLEIIIYKHYLTELGFKQKQRSRNLKGTKRNFPWIDDAIHWIQFKLQSISIHDISRLYTQFIKTETRLKTLRNLNPHPVENTLEHSWLEDRITQTEEELEEQRQELTKKCPNEFEALKDWTEYTRSLEQEVIDDISRSS